MGETLAVAMVLAVCALLLVGYPVAFTLAGVSLGFAALGAGLDIMNFALLGALPARIFGIITNDVLLAIPLFIFMGVMLERSRIAEELLETMGRLFGRLPGGLGVSVIIVGVLLAAAKGVVGATTVTMGLIVLPTMPLAAAKSTPTTITDMPSPPGKRPNSRPIVSNSSSATRERSSITPMKMKSGIASSTSLVMMPKMRAGSAPRSAKSMIPKAAPRPAKASDTPASVNATG